MVHPCEAELLCKSTIDKVPHFNAPVYLENKEKIGKVDEVLGAINGTNGGCPPDDGLAPTRASSFRSSLHGEAGRGHDCCLVHQEPEVLHF
jgi:hypothetical protein